MIMHACTRAGGVRCTRAIGYSERSLKRYYIYVSIQVIERLLDESIQEMHVAAICWIPQYLPNEIGS